MRKLNPRLQDESVKAIYGKDPQMIKLVIAIGHIDIPLRSDHLSSIVRSIVG